MDKNKLQFHCGVVNIKGKDEKGKRLDAKNKHCCKKLEKKGNDCDHVYFPQGPAFTDMTDFARDEKLWLRKYQESWHMATENGSTLKFLDPKRGPSRHNLTKVQAHNCMSPPDQCKKKKIKRGGKSYPCHRIKAGAAFPDRNFSPLSCMNKNRLVSAQRPNGVSAIDW